MNEPRGLVEAIPYHRDEVPFPLGRAMVHHDPMNRLFAALEDPGRPARARNLPWYRRSIFDQLSDDCTMNMAVGVLRETHPHAKLYKPLLDAYDTATERVAGYQASQDFDPWPGRDYAGTSTDAPFRLLRSLGIIPRWRWLFGFEEMKEWLLHYGPVGIGVNWYEQMFYPDDKGRIVIGGQLAGGHAVEALYWSPRYGTRVPNSWGPEWGQNGRCWVPDEMMIELLGQQGEVVTL
jgi:hypothetical protein